MQSRKPLVSVCVPTFNSARIIRPMLESLEKQSYKNFEVVVSDDASNDDTIDVIKSFHFNKLRIHRNKKNLGYGKNLQQLEKMPKGEIIYLLAHDDILINDGIRKATAAFLKDPKVGVVTRAYYWFDVDPKKPVRQVSPLNPKRTEFIDIRKTPEKITPIIESVGQLSGLAYRRDLFTHFYHEVFPAHIYPFMQILKVAKCAFLKDYTIAVGIFDSQTRSRPSIYDVSPTESWMKMFDTVFSEEQFRDVREIAKDHMAKNYLGFIQLKNYGRSPWAFYREVVILIKKRWKNILSPVFWLIFFSCVVIPRRVLRFLTDKLKKYSVVGQN